ncbi:sulfiredoxin [Klebsormidium nitens]|uniref:sulfiredoxin n=1 Tax=Klebsormidium nitens TaxID=105231 RepID=A0A1Y1HXX4_KLENI|nr:sulfiredoxin [Klebsormidium nitens]|eukprot:GAQ83495.1 sulfiredoxin [Klebsormidium nitens]
MPCGYGTKRVETQLITYGNPHPQTEIGCRSSTCIQHTGFCSLSPSSAHKQYPLYHHLNWIRSRSSWSENFSVVCFQKARVSVVTCAADGEADGAPSSVRYKRIPRLRIEIMELPIEYIIRPLQKTRKYDQEKVQGLADSIAEIGLQEPIDVIEVDGQYYGFSGCHRFEAHLLLGKPTILCSVRKGTQRTLRDHLS